MPRSAGASATAQVECAAQTKLLARANLVLASGLSTVEWHIHAQAENLAFESISEVFRLVLPCCGNVCSHRIVYAFRHSSSLMHR